MPGRGTRVRGFRIPDDLYAAAMAKAEARGEVLGEEVRKFLERYVQRQDKPHRQRRPSSDASKIAKPVPHGDKRRRNPNT